MTGIQSYFYGLGDGTKTVPDTAVVEGTAKAWANIEAPDVEVSSFNVSSLTDDGTGLSQLNFTNSFINIEYAVLASIMATTLSATNARYQAWNSIPDQAVGECRIETGFENGATVDWQDKTYSVTILGDLA